MLLSNAHTCTIGEKYHHKIQLQLDKNHIFVSMDISMVTMDMDIRMHGNPGSNMLPSNGI